MSIKVYLDRIPQSPEDRQELLAKREKERENQSQMELSMLQKILIDFLVSQKGYSPEELETGKVFSIALPDTTFRVTADIMVRTAGRSFLYVKCSSSSLESWERHSFAFCHIAEPFQIPYALITDGETTRFLDVMGGSSVAGGLELIPSREEAKEGLKDIPAVPFPPEKTEKEKRILHAFDAIRCP